MKAYVVLLALCLTACSHSPQPNSGPRFIGLQKPNWLGTRSLESRDKAKQLIEEDPEKAANCFNTVARYHGLKNKPEHMSLKQIASLLSENFRILTEAEKPEAGDVISVWKHDVDLVTAQRELHNKETPSLRHAFVYMGGGLVFEKFGSGKKYPYNIYSFYEAIEYYTKNPKYSQKSDSKTSHGPAIVFLRTL